MSGTDVVLALDAYSTGEAVGRVVMATLGAALVRSGLRRRAQGRAAVSPAPSAPADDRWAWMGAPAPAAVGVPSAPAAAGAPAAAPAGFDFFAAPSTAPASPAAWSSATAVPASAPAPGGALPRVLVGAVLLTVALVSLVLQVTRLGDPRIELPSQLLGMQKDEKATAMSRDVVDAVSGHVPGGMPHFEIGVYGTLPSAVVVMASEAGSSAPATEVRSVPPALATQYALDAGTDVGTGDAEAARCWTGQQQGRPVVLCAFLDRDSTVIVIDYTGNDLATASGAARAVRAAVVD